MIKSFKSTLLIKIILDTYDLGILELDEQSTATTNEKPVDLPLDREPNRSVNTRFKPKLEQEKAKENSAEVHEILTKPDELINVE